MPAYEVVTTDGNTIHVEHSGETPTALLRAAHKDGYFEAVEVITVAGHEPRRHAVAIAFHSIALIRPKAQI